MVIGRPTPVNAHDDLRQYPNPYISARAIEGLENQKFFVENMNVFGQIDAGNNKAAFDLNEAKTKNKNLENFMKKIMRDFKSMQNNFEETYTEQVKILTKKMSQEMKSTS